MRNILFQKTGIIISELALDFAGRNIGDKIPSVSEYQKMFGASRGTVQNAIKYLKEKEAVIFQNRGHMGTVIKKLDMSILQDHFTNKGIIGVMPLPYSKLYQGLATALELKMENINCNLVYNRGAFSRIKLVDEGLYQFAICSKHAAQKAIEDGMKIEIAIDFGVTSYLSKHVILFANTRNHEIKEGMKIAYDPLSIDQSELTKMIVAGKENIELVKIRSHQTVGKLLKGELDAGVWNYDEVVETGCGGLHFTEIPDDIDATSFSTAVMIVSTKKTGYKSLLKKHIDSKEIREIQSKVKTGEIMAIY